MFARGFLPLPSQHQLPQQQDPMVLLGTLNQVLGSDEYSVEELFSLDGSSSDSSIDGCARERASPIQYTPHQMQPQKFPRTSFDSNDMTWALNDQLVPVSRIPLATSCADQLSPYALARLPTTSTQQTSMPDPSLFLPTDLLQPRSAPMVPHIPTTPMSFSSSSSFVDSLDNSPVGSPIPTLPDASHLQANLELLDVGHWTELMREGEEIAQYLKLHYLRHLDPKQWTAKNIRNPKKYLTTNLKSLRDLLAANRLVCWMLRLLWTEHPMIASWLDGYGLQCLATYLQGMPPEIVLGCVDFLGSRLTGDWYLRACNPKAAVQTEVNNYIAQVRGTAVASL